jgi:predicted alpha/beta superfamily hydrolase
MPAKNALTSLCQTRNIKVAKPIFWPHARRRAKAVHDQNYRTRAGAAHTGLGGSSLGGLLSLYLGLKYPLTFGRLAVISPSVWWADKQIVKFVERLERKPKVRIWLDIGTKEGRDTKDATETVANTKLLNETLIKKGWQSTKDLKYFEAEGAEHNERAWASDCHQS